MDQQVQIFPAKLYDKATLRRVSIKIQGLPEDVQRIADAIELAVPGAMSWQSCANRKANYLIEVIGTSAA